MTEPYDTYNDGAFETEVVADEDCCCDDGLSSGAVYGTDAPPFEEVVYDEPVYATTEVPYDAPVAGGYEPIGETIHEPIYQPVAEPAPVVAFTAPAPAPVADTGIAPNFATIGGDDPYGAMTIIDPAGQAVVPAALIGGASTIGGGDPYSGITIVDGAGNTVDPSVLSPGAGVIGSSNGVFGYGFTMVPDPNAPVYANPMPTVPIVPSPNDSLNDIAVRNVTNMRALNDLSRAQDPNR